MFDQVSWKTKGICEKLKEQKKVRQKTRNFLINFLRSAQKKAFWPVFVWNFACCQQGSFYCSGIARKINWFKLKKIDGVLEKFLTIRTTLHKTLHPHLKGSVESSELTKNTCHTIWYDEKKMLFKLFQWPKKILWK